MEEFLTAAFWTAVAQIVVIDVLLGGDNAVVIALACRNLPANQRRQGDGGPGRNGILKANDRVRFTLELDLFTNRPFGGNQNEFRHGEVTLFQYFQDFAAD